MLELPNLLLGNIGFRTEARLLDVSDNRGQSSTDLVDVVVDATCGQVQLLGDGAHRMTILEDHQNDGGVGGGDAAALGGLMDGLDGHVGCMGPATQRVGIRICKHRFPSARWADHQQGRLPSLDAKHQNYEMELSMSIYR